MCSLCGNKRFWIELKIEDKKTKTKFQTFLKIREHFLKTRGHLCCLVLPQPVCLWFWQFSTYAVSLRTFLLQYVRIWYSPRISLKPITTWYAHSHKHLWEWFIWGYTRLGRTNKWINVELRQPDKTRRVSPGTEKIPYTSIGIRLSHTIHLVPLFLTWFIFNTRIDKYSYDL